MNDSNNILGVLVNSDEYFDYVLKLTAAATAKGKEVRIHLLDKGLGLLFSEVFAPLNRLARITACAEGMRAVAPDAPLCVPGSVKMISPLQLALILKGVDRTVVF